MPILKHTYIYVKYIKKNTECYLFSKIKIIFFINSLNIIIIKLMYKMPICSENALFEG